MLTLTRTNNSKIEKEGSRPLSGRKDGHEVQQPISIPGARNVVDLHLQTKKSSGIRSGKDGWVDPFPSSEYYKIYCLTTICLILEIGKPQSHTSPHPRTSGELREAHHCKHFSDPVLLQHPQSREQGNLPFQALQLSLKALASCPSRLW